MAYHVGIAIPLGVVGVSSQREVKDLLCSLQSPSREIRSSGPSQIGVRKKVTTSELRLTKWAAR